MSALTSVVSSSTAKTENILSNVTAVFLILAWRATDSEDPARLMVSRARTRTVKRADFALRACARRGAASLARETLRLGRRGGDGDAAGVAALRHRQDPMHTA